MKTVEIAIETNITITSLYDIEIEDNEDIDEVKERERKKFEDSLPKFYGMYDLQINTDVEVEFSE